MLIVEDQASSIVDVILAPGASGLDQLVERAHRTRELDLERVPRGILVATGSLPLRQFIIGEGEEFDTGLRHLGHGECARRRNLGQVLVRGHFGGPFDTLLYVTRQAVEPFEIAGVDLTVRHRLCEGHIAQDILEPERKERTDGRIERIGYANFDANATATGLIGGLRDDDDLDGLVNGLEFYFGTDAKQWTFDDGTSAQMVGGVVQYQIPVNGDAVADGIMPSIQDSVNLVDWYEAGTLNSILSFDSDTSGVGVSGTQIWEVLPGNDRGFFRMGLSN